jgi:hypothetical protein
MKRCILILTTLLALCIPAAQTAAAGVYFDDSRPDLLILGNTGYYEIGLRKTNGSVAYITDKTTGGSVTGGSRYGCLWGASFPDGNPSFVGGCHYNTAGPNRFSYTWAASTQTLRLTYTPDPNAGQRVAAQVTVKPSAGPWLDMQLQLRNEWGYVLDWVLFPCDTMFAEAEIREALLPVLPGVSFTPQFFQENRSYTAKYPGYPGLFADFAWISTTGGRIAIYAITGPGPIPPNVIGFIHDEEYSPDSSFYYHTFGARVANNGAFTSPWVRLRVGEDAMDAIRAYRIDNGMDRYPSLTEKLGARYDQIVQSPLYKVDTGQLGAPFSAYAGILARVPAPGILHPVAFQPGGHDEKYPDFLPPATAWGTTADMAAMFRLAQAHGFLVMPYTNPTWWDDESPTLRTLLPPFTIKDVAVLDQNGVPQYEYYGTHGGYVMSPCPDFVRARLDRLVDQMTTEVPSDLLFEDQIGARPWLFDHNASSPSPLAYTDGWLAHTRAHSDTLLMTELAFDRLAETEVGFHGSVLLPEVSGYTADWWGAGTWRPYPLATAMARDKVLFYQHDLAPETMTTQKSFLTWNLAMGYMLSYDLFKSEFGGGLDSEWLGLVSIFQKHVLARYAWERVTGYTDLAHQVTRTAFETCDVIANWDATNGYATSGYTLSPQGVLVMCDDGGLAAGIFTRYNGTALSPDDHYLIETRGPWGSIVRQPIGPDTDLTLALLPGWGTRGPATALALDAADQVVGTVPVTIRPAGLTFRHRKSLAGKTVAAYRLPNPPGIYLPLLLR